MKIISIVNHKGGVGKTTTTANLGVGLALKHKKTLLIDMDPQAGLTTSLKIVTDNEDTTYYCLLLRKKISECIKETKIKNLFIVPSTLDLSGAESELMGQIGFESTLKSILKPLPNFDYVIIDSPPSLGILTINCIIAAQHLLIPVQCEFLSLKALAQLGKVIEKALKINPHLTKKILFTLYNKRAIHCKEVVEEIKKHFLTYNSIITRTIKFAETSFAGEPVILYYKNSESAKQYWELTSEVISEERGRIKK